MSGIGKKITTIRRILQLALQGKAVVFRETKPKAAAFFQNWPACLLQRSLDMGCFYEYKKTKGTK